MFSVSVIVLDALSSPIASAANVSLSPIFTFVPPEATVTPVVTPLATVTSNFTFVSVPYISPDWRATPAKVLGLTIAILPFFTALNNGPGEVLELAAYVAVVASPLLKEPLLGEIIALVTVKLKA